MKDIIAVFDVVGIVILAMLVLWQLNQIRIQHKSGLVKKINELHEEIKRVEGLTK